MGRATYGVFGVRLGGVKDDQVVAMAPVDPRLPVAPHDHLDRLRQAEPDLRLPEDEAWRQGRADDPDRAAATASSSRSSRSATTRRSSSRRRTGSRSAMAVTVDPRPGPEHDGRPDHPARGGRRGPRRRRARGLPRERRVPPRARWPPRRRRPAARTATMPRTRTRRTRPTRTGWCTAGRGVRPARSARSAAPTGSIFNSGMITGQVYHCLKCDYVGSLVFETDLPSGDAVTRTGIGRAPFPAAPLRRPPRDPARRPPGSTRRSSASGDRRGTPVRGSGLGPPGGPADEAGGTRTRRVPFGRSARGRARSPRLPARARAAVPREGVPPAPSPRRTARAPSVRTAGWRSLGPGRALDRDLPWPTAAELRTAAGGARAPAPPPGAAAQPSRSSGSRAWARCARRARAPARRSDVVGAHDVGALERGHDRGRDARLERSSTGALPSAQPGTTSATADATG